MKLGNLLVLWFLGILLCGVLMFAGWGVAFTFAYNVFVPWLGVVPPEYYKLAAVVSAFVFAGAGTVVVALVLVAIGLAAAAVWRRL